MRRFQALVWVLLFGAAAAAQDEDPAAESEIPRLVDQLGSDDFASREEAERKLVEIGPPAEEAVRQCLQSADAEVRDRARRILDAIEQKKLLARSFQPPPPVTVEFEGPLADLVRILEEKTGVSMTSIPDPQCGETVQVAFKKASLFTVLDELCAKIGSIRWTMTPEGGIRFEKGKFVRVPTFVNGPFRIRVTRLESFERNTFAEKTFAWAVTLKGDALPGVETFGAPGIVLHEVTDDRGTKLKASGEMFVLGQKGNPAQQVVQWLGPADDSDGQVFQFVGKERIGKLGAIRGTAVYYFLLPEVGLRFKLANPSGGLLTQQVDGLQIKLQVGLRFSRVAGGGNKRVPYLRLQFDPLSDSDGYLAGRAGRLVDPKSFVAVDRDGKEHVLQGTYQANRWNVRIVNGRPVRQRSDLWMVTAPDVRMKDLSEFRFRLRRLHRYAVDFELTDVDLR